MKRTATPKSIIDRDTVPEVKLDAVYPQPPDRVWHALTDPAQLAQWLMPNDFAPRLGHRFTFRDRRGPAIRCEVIALEESRRLVYTWQRGSEEPLSVVTWSLEPISGGATRVPLTHTGPHASLSFSCRWPAALRRLSHVQPALRVPVSIAAPRTSLWRNHV